MVRGLKEFVQNRCSVNSRFHNDGIDAERRQFEAIGISDRFESVFTRAIYAKVGNNDPARARADMNEQPACAAFS
jgi:hypothetical protein